MSFGFFSMVDCAQPKSKTCRVYSTSELVLESGQRKVGDFPNYFKISTEGVAVADEFPGAEVVGVDLSPIQPTWSEIPF